jgi:hypothetical protein
MYICPTCGDAGDDRDVRMSMRRLPSSGNLLEADGIYHVYLPMHIYMNVYARKECLFL